MALMQRAPQGAATNGPMSQYVGSEDASPEEQAQYEQLLEVALTSVHDDQTGDLIFQMVTESDSIPRGIARAVVTILERLSVDTNGALMDSVRLELGEDLVEEIVDLLIRSGRLTEADVTDEFIENVVNLAYEEASKLKDMQGGDNSDNARDDVTTAQSLGFAPEMPQGVNAMSSPEAARQQQGLMARGS